MLVALFLPLMAKTKTVILDGRITKIDGAIIEVGGKTTLRGMLTEKSRVWLRRERASAEDLSVGMTVRGRFKVDEAAVELREIADSDSAVWLEKIRTRYVPARVARLDSQGWWLEVEGREHFYKKTASTQMDVPEPKAGDAFYVRGRMLASLDTSLVHATAQAPPPGTGNEPLPPLPGEPMPPPTTPPLPSPIPRPGKPIPVPDLPRFGTVTVTVRAILPGVSTFDGQRAEGPIVHFRVTRETTFYIDRKKAPFNPDWLGQKVRVKYRQDQVGRYLAIRVDMVAG